MSAVEVYPNLFVGKGEDIAGVMVGGDVLPEWYVISAAKEPFHREALGYTGRAATKDHAEYLVAYRPRRMILNLVDVEDPAYIRKEIIDRALVVITTFLWDGYKVLVHCNQGGSRGPSIAFLWLAKCTSTFAGLDLETALERFKAIYPAYAPAKGFEIYIAKELCP